MSFVSPVALGADPTAPVSCTPSTNEPREEAITLIGHRLQEWGMMLKQSNDGQDAFIVKGSRWFEIEHLKNVFIDVVWNRYRPQVLEERDQKMRVKLRLEDSSIPVLSSLAASTSSSSCSFETPARLTSSEVLDAIMNKEDPFQYKEHIRDYADELFATILSDDRYDSIFLRMQIVTVLVEEKPEYLIANFRGLFPGLQFASLYCLQILKILSELCKKADQKTIEGEVFLRGMAHFLREIKTAYEQLPPSTFLTRTEAVSCSSSVSWSSQAASSSQEASPSSVVPSPRKELTISERYFDLLVQRMEMGKILREKIGYSLITAFTKEELYKGPYSSGLLQEAF